VKVRFAPRALAEAKRRKIWWLKNRPAAPELFELELGAMLAVLPTTPLPCEKAAKLGNVPTSLHALLRLATLR
jgi:hypothetical protein